MLNTHLLAYCLVLASMPTHAEDVVRPRPDGWDKLTFGGRFMDRLEPMPNQTLSANGWGLDGVKPRMIDNGIEDNTWSYWGGNIYDDKQGQYHLFVCRWREDHVKGHMAWPQSEVAHAVSDNSIGPFTVKSVIGKGHNPELHRLENGLYFLYVNRGYYLADSLDGPWQYREFDYDQRQRPIVDHMTNNTFAKREDGSVLMVGRGGGIWFSQNGLPPYAQISEKTVYPPFEGRYEDPVVWRTHIQYHLIVNDWLGRIAYYMRSKDGIHWKLDAGEAYLPGVARHQDGRVENWYKFERIKMLQDSYGRAYQANFAVNDTIKRQDLGGDIHSSKNISIPLTVPRLITLLNEQKIDKDTKVIQLKIDAEPGFDPHHDIDISSLRFGASEKVDFGHGAKAIRSKKKGKDLIITFSGKGNGLTEENFAAKLLGKTSKGQLLFGFARLPWIDYNQQALSAKYPELSLNAKKLKVELDIINFGQITSKKSPVKIEYLDNEKWHSIAQTNIKPLQPFEESTLVLKAKKFLDSGEVAEVRVTIKQEGQPDAVLQGKVVIR